MPKQIPKTGCFNAVIKVSKFLCCRYCIAVLASPTPGKITLSADLICSGSSVTIASTPKRSSAYKTD